jgi:hypothetical protein
VLRPHRGKPDSQWIGHSYKWQFADISSDWRSAAGASDGPPGTAVVTLQPGSHRPAKGSDPPMTWLSARWGTPICDLTGQWWPCRRTARDRPQPQPLPAAMSLARFALPALPQWRPTRRRARAVKFPHGRPSTPQPARVGPVGIGIAATAVRLPCPMLPNSSPLPDMAPSHPQRSAVPKKDTRRNTY